MLSMACLILRAAARVSSSAALAAYRFAEATRAAAAARSGSGGAAASDPVKRSSSVAAAGSARSPASSGSFHPLTAAGPPSTIDKLQAVMDGSHFVQPDWATFEATKKDLESDDALWGLYERWCKVFNQERDREEMARRFSYFKETVLRVEENKKSDLPYSLGINKFADGKVREQYRKSSIRNHVSASPVYGSEVGFSFNKDPAANKGPSQVKKA